MYLLISIVTPVLRGLHESHASTMSDEDIDFHPIELTAHSLLSGSLDTLHESFVQLHQSQHILVTRLRILEDKLKHLDRDPDDPKHDVVVVQARVRSLRKKLAEVAKTLVKVNERVAAIEAR